MSIPQADIDHILRMEGNADYARMKIATEFSKGKSVEEIAAFLQSSFHGGNGVVTENGRYSAWYADDGIHIANGDAARYLTSAKVVSWQEAAARISELLEQGEYATNVELAEAPGHERTELAQSIWYLRQDLSEKARAQGYLSCLSDMRGGGFPEETARLAERLTDPAFREVLMDDLAQLRSDCREDRSLLRFHYHKPDKIEQGLRELSLPRREYRTEMAEIPAVQRFITEDEIAATLTRGSNVEGSKGRIYAYFKEKHSPREQADFLKDEYGIGGRSHAVSGASHSGEDHSGKGVSLKKQDCPDVQLKWSKVASRISELIRKDRFLTPEEKTQYEQLQRQTAARSAAWNDYNAVKEAHPDDLVLFQVGDFFELYGEDAVKLDLISSNPADKIERPKKERFMANFYDADEVNRLFEISKGTKLEIPILFGAFYGMRRSETLGMKWDAIDFERDTITIRHTLTTVALDGKRITVAEDRTKNKSSMRTLPLVPFVKERLLELKAEQEENRRLCGRSYVKDYTGYVCINEIGDIIKPNYVSCGFPKLLEEHGLRRVRYHDLRHSCASLLLANGVPMKQIQEWLGHSDFSTTANIYAHLEYSSKVISADAMLAGLGIGNRE